VIVKSAVLSIDKPNAETLLKWAIEFRVHFLQFLCAYGT